MTKLSVSVALVIGDPQRGPGILIVQRADHEASFAGHWELPGGGIEDGETWILAAHREIAEETGLEIDRLAPKPYFEFMYGDPPITERHFMAIPKPGEIRLNPDEHQAWRIVRCHADLDGLFMSDTLRESVMLAIERADSPFPA